MYISQIAQLTGLTPRAIRHYEDLGLVSLIREGSKDRWFDLEARTRLLFIARLRRAGLSLAEIGHVIEIGRHDHIAQRVSLTTMLLLRRRELGALCGFVDEALSDIEALFNGAQCRSGEDRGPRQLRGRSRDAGLEPDKLI
ncbi:MAG: MerR family transcriptional regulator [Caulobacter sp.]|nr:MerR family transcriptional regulator [Caulobacter sp.]